MCVGVCVHLELETSEVNQKHAKCLIIPMGYFIFALGRSETPEKKKIQFALTMLLLQARWNGVEKKYMGVNYQC